MKSLAECKMLSLKKVKFPQLKTNYLKCESTSCASSTSSKENPQQPAKNEIFEQLFLRNRAPFKFFLQASTKKSCLFCLALVSKSGVADLPSSPVVGAAGLQAEPDFRFRFGS